MFELQGKVALVTGGSRGIGRTIVLALSRAGAEVAFCYRRSSAAADAVRAEVEANTGHRALAVAADVAEDDGRKRLIAEVRGRFETVDILVNNAGIMENGLAVRMSEGWGRLLDLNLTAPFRLSQLVIPLMLKHSWGRIINIGSVASRIGPAGQVNYAAAKAGLEGMTRSLAQEYGKRGITVNTVNPGFIETELTGSVSDFIRRYVIDFSSIGRYITPEAVASTVQFLSSNEAWAVTGQTINVDGGLVKL